MIDMVDGVIFDFNGVLLFDGDIQEQVWNDLAIRYRGCPLAPKDKTDSIHGKTTKAIFECLLNRTLSDSEAEEMIKIKEEEYRQECLRRKAAGTFILSPGSEELLDYLVKNEVPFTIATSSSYDDLALFIRELDLNKWFNKYQLIYNDGTFPGKPKPDIFLKAANAIGVAPEKCLVFEDAMSGIKAADAAKIGMIYGIGSSINYEETQSSIKNLVGVVPTLADVPKHIFKSNQT